MNWKKQFDDLWEDLYFYDRDIEIGHPYLRCEGKVKAFISKLLSQQKDEMIKRVENKYKDSSEYPLDSERQIEADNYNQAIDDILSALKGKE